MIYSNKKNKKGGYSLLEMMFVLSIFSILTMVTVFNYGKFNNNILMTNMAYEVALIFRQAQVYTLSTRAVDSGSAFDNFDISYGVYINTDTADSGDPKKLLFFADRHDDDTGIGDLICKNGTSVCSLSTCTIGADNECQEIITLTSNIQIDKICASNDSETLFDVYGCDTGATEYESINVLFKKPLQNPIFSDDGGEEIDEKNIAILLKSPNDAMRAIKILETGQISVDFIKN